ncbi:MAG: rhodanese-like domain-containing protein [Alphaproteobacteria bacterium]
MGGTVKRIDAKALKAAFHDGGEIALLDAREEVPFDARHLLMASCVPLGRLEALVGDLAPRRDTRIVWCDDGEGYAERAAARMAALGWTDVSVLDGGIDAWDAAGFPMYSGVHVPSKAFAEVVEHEAGTPYISAAELKDLMDRKADIAIFDSRSYEEYHSNSIPGAISVPGAELVYRFRDLTPSPDTMVIVNCGGRTRSIIGAQSLINAGVPNRVVSLMNGTQDWHLAGYEVVRDATRRPPPVSPEGLKAAQEAARRVAQRAAIRTIDAATLESWRADPARTLYVLDVRTPEEYEAGRLPGVRSAPGGQLIQETDVFCGAWGARVVLVDDNGVRATMTASWMRQMGWDAVVMTFDPAAPGLETGPHAPKVLGADSVSVATIEPAALHDRLAAGGTVVVDLDYSRPYREGHIPGAWYAMRTELETALTKLPAHDTLVFTSPDGALARLAAADAGGAAMALNGGTLGWKAAGLPLETGDGRMASTPADIRLKAREQGKDVEAAMREYLAWEIELVNQMAADEEQRFKVMA